MIDMQTAAEGAKTGGAWIAIAFDGTIVAAIIAALTKGDLWGRKRNGGPRPGEAPSCQEHGKKLDGQVEKIAKLEEWKSGAQGDLAIIKADIKTLLSRVPARED